MNKDIIKGMRIGFGIFLSLGFLFGLVYAGTHLASQVIPGTFIGNFVFQGNTTFNGSVETNSYMKLGGNGSCNSSLEGAIKYDSVNNSILVCDGVLWDVLYTKINNTDCNSIYSSLGTGSNGYFTIDPDGVGGQNSYQVYCEFFNNSGWTLYSSFNFSTYSSYTGLIEPNSVFYMDQTRFNSLYANSDYFMLKGVTSGKRLFLNKTSADSATCHNMSIPGPIAVSAYVVYGHKETTGCTLSGGDYSGVWLSVTTLFSDVSAGPGPVWEQDYMGGSTASWNGAETKILVYTR